MNKHSFNAKQFFLFMLLFFISPILIDSFAQELIKNVNLQTIEPPIAKTTATPRKILGNMRFRHEMAELLGEKVGADDSGDVYKAGGLAGYYTDTKKLFPEKGEMRKYNISNIEQLTYEMLVDIIGAIYKAKTQLPIIPTVVGLSSYWELPSWDRFSIPKPFSRALMMYGDPIHIPPNLSEEEMEHYRLLLENTMKEIAEKADALVRQEL